jgi:hypothetical protein
MVINYDTRPDYIKAGGLHPSVAQSKQIQPKDDSVQLVSDEWIDACMGGRTIYIRPWFLWISEGGTLDSEGNFIGFGLYQSPDGLILTLLVIMLLIFVPIVWFCSK